MSITTEIFQNHGRTLSCNALFYLFSHAMKMNEMMKCDILNVSCFLFSKIKLLEGSSVYVRLSDARRAEELPAPKV